MAHCGLHRLAVCMVSALREALDRDGEVTIRQGHLSGDMGRTWFDGRTIYLDADLSGPEFRSTLMHELQHLVRGPVPSEQAPAEEQAVRREATRRLVPDGDAIAAIGTDDTRDEVPLLARLYGVDIDTMLSALDEYTSRRPTGHPPDACTAGRRVEQQPAQDGLRDSHGLTLTERQALRRSTTEAAESYLSCARALGRRPADP